MGDVASPFRPGGPMVSLLGSSSNAGSATLINMSGDFSLLAFNRSGSFDAYLAYGSSSSAVAGAVMPVVGVGVPTGSGANLLQMPARTIQTFTLGGPTFISVIVPAGNAICDFAAGEGE